MPATYDCIKSSILGSSASVVTFDNISANYTDLILIVNAASDTTNAFQYIQFNGDTGSNYSYTQMYGNVLLLILQGPPVALNYLIQMFL